jgi:hypothetical protein
VGAGPFPLFCNSKFFLGAAVSSTPKTPNVVDQGLHFIWSLSFDLFGMGYPTKSVRPRQRNSRVTEERRPTNDKAVYLILRNTALLEKLIVAHKFRKFYESYGNVSFITMFTAVHHRSLSWARWILSTTGPSYFFKIDFSIILPIEFFKYLITLYESGFRVRTIDRNGIFALTLALSPHVNMKYHANNKHCSKRALKPAYDVKHY